MTASAQLINRTRQNSITSEPTVLVAPISKSKDKEDKSFRKTNTLYNDLPLPYKKEMLTYLTKYKRNKKTIQMILV